MMPHPAHNLSPLPGPDPREGGQQPPGPEGFMGGMGTGRFVLTTVRQLAPSLLLSVACTVVVYSLLRPHFPPSSIVPLLAASLFPVLGNILSVVRHRRPDIFGVMVLIGLAVSVIGVLLGGGQRLLLLRESFVTGAIGLALLVSLVLPKPLGYYFARQLMAADDPQRRARFDGLWQHPPFRRALRGGTIFWGVLLLGEFGVRIAMILTLPVVVVLAISPIVLNALILGGVAVSAIWGSRALRRGDDEVAAAAIRGGR